MVGRAAELTIGQVDTDEHLEESLGVPLRTHRMETEQVVTADPMIHRRIHLALLAMEGRPETTAPATVVAQVPVAPVPQPVRQPELVAEQDQAQPVPQVRLAPAEVAPIRVDQKMTRRKAIS